jgi:hypothetical protein
MGGGGGRGKREEAKQGQRNDLKQTIFFFIYFISMLDAFKVMQYSRSRCGVA